ncbi:hypothetical protein Tco_1502685 [Tanacetum coccineum]
MLTDVLVLHCIAVLPGDNTTLIHPMPVVVWARRRNNPARATQLEVVKRRRKTKQATRATMPTSCNASFSLSNLPKLPKRPSSFLASVLSEGILNRLDRGGNSSLSEMQVETELSPGECIGCYMKVTGISADIEPHISKASVRLYYTQYSTETWVKQIKLKSNLELVRTILTLWFRGGGNVFNGK